MIVCKMFVDQNEKGKDVLKIKVAPGVENNNISPAGKWQDPEVEELNGVRFWTFVHGTEGVLLSPEAKAAFYSLVTPKDKSKYKKYGDIGIYKEGKEGQGVGFKFAPLDIKKSPDAEFVLGGDVRVDVSEGYNPEVLTQFVNVMTNEQVKSYEFDHVKKNDEHINSI